MYDQSKLSELIRFVDEGASGGDPHDRRRAPGYQVLRLAMMRSATSRRGARVPREAHSLTKRMCTLFNAPQNTACLIASPTVLKG